MSIDLLSTPLRISWLLSSDGQLAAGDVVVIAERLVEAGVFYVTLEGGALIHPQINDILGILADGGLQVVLICTGTDAELKVLQSDLPLRQVYLDAAPYLAPADFSTLSEQLETIRSRGFEPGLLLVPRHNNIAEIPRLLAFCRTHRVAKFKLPNISIDVSVKNLFEAGLVTPEDLQNLGHELPSTDVSGLELEVHDLFLWELLCSERLDARSEYGGCQAANSLGHIDFDGNLYPCSSWPEKLGSLLEHSVEELWDLPARLLIREEISATPEGCRGCRDWSICYGGCRGLGRTFNRHRGCRDPMCSEPRK